MEKCKLIIKNSYGIQEPVVLEGIQWETVRKGEPGKLTFTCVKTPTLSFNEGNEVGFYYDGKKVFHGYVFEKTRDKEHHIQVTCYDQMRYLKNKTSCAFNGVSVHDVFERICTDFKLKWANKTERIAWHLMERFEHMDATLFDMILSAIEDNLKQTGFLYYIYDDFGTLTMKDIKQSFIEDIIIDAGTAENFDYTTSIDKNTCNSLIIVDSQDETKMTRFAVTDDKRVGDWGLLQNVISMNTSGVDINQLRRDYIKHYCKVSRSLSIKRQFGDIRVRAGTGLYLTLNVGDKEYENQKMLVDKATHTFENGSHYMDLTLMGAGEFYDS